MRAAAKLLGHDHIDATCVTAGGSPMKNGEIGAELARFVAPQVTFFQ